MTVSKVNVRELIAWDLDDYPYRDAAAGVDSVKLDERTGREDSLPQRASNYSCH